MTNQGGEWRRWNNVFVVHVVVVHVPPAGRPGEPAFERDSVRSQACAQRHRMGRLEAVRRHTITHVHSSYGGKKLDRWFPKASKRSGYQKILLGILTWRGSNSDHGGDSSRARLFHCTRTGLTPAITANVGNSTVQFLVVGVCVRAHPLLYTIKSAYK